MNVLEQKIIEVENKIKETRKRFPFHSVQPYLIQELEDLEEELDQLREQLKRKKSTLN